jgi:hypothetical protein
MIKKGVSQKNLLEMISALAPLENWLKAYPDATEMAALKVIRSNQEKILKILPGRNCAAHDRLLQDFNALTNSSNFDTL